MRLTNGKNFFAPLVIANGDVVAALTELADPALLPSDYAHKLSALRRGPTAMLANLALSTVMPLPARIFIRKNGFEFGIGNPSVLDSSLAPEGCSSVTMLCLLHETDGPQWLVRDRTYAQRKQAFCDRMIGAVADSVFPDIHKHIVYEEIATPATFAAFTAAHGGAIYGAARGGWRPALRSPITGLLLVGGGTETGAGIEAVVVSGTRAANLIGDVDHTVKSA